MNLGRMLARERWAYLHRDRLAWEEHLAKARAFLGEGLRQADPERPVLILGAGTGLEVPWSQAPGSTFGWDADPWSRLGTALRHRRFPPWVFEDFTGGFAELRDTAKRARTLPWSNRSRPAAQGVQRLAGLLPSLRPRAAPLRAWVEDHEPGTILVANVLGQLGVLAERVVEGVFPADIETEGANSLMEALDAWTARTVVATLEVLRGSGARVWMLHDRAVIHGDPQVRLGPLEGPWAQQLQGEGVLEVQDPLCGVDVLEVFSERQTSHFERWLWPVGPGQLHLMEAVAYSS